MIVGFTGYKRSGKDTAAEALTSRGWTRYALADPLRVACGALFGWSAERMEQKEQVDQYWGISPRHALQVVGTELIREKLPEHVPGAGKLWIKLLNRFYSDSPTPVCVTDVRFPDEAQSIHDLGGILIRINRAGCGPDGHKSEEYIRYLPADYDIVNGSTVSELHDNVIDIVGKHSPGI